MGTLGKVDGVTVKLNKSIKAKDRGRKKKVERTTQIHGSDILGAQKGSLRHKRTNTGLSKTKEELSQRKDEPHIKVVPKRNPFNVGNLIMSTAKQISHPAYNFHYILPSSTPNIVSQA